MGATVTIELLANAPRLATRVFLRSGCERGDGLDMVESLCGRHGIAVERGDKPFNVLCGRENCYVMAEFRKFGEPLRDSPLHIVLVNPSNAGNLGTIVRTMAGFGLADIAVVRPAADVFDPKAVRASMGAIFHVRCAEFDSFEAYAAANSGRRCYPFMTDARTTVGEAVFQKPCALIFGNESSGLPAPFLSVGEPISIPCSEAIDSFSLPVAAAIAIYAAKTRAGQ
jgi:TrmH family RNA methyltransferase